jgi:hypothetical protein
MDGEHADSSIVLCSEELFDGSADGSNLAITFAELPVSDALVIAEGFVPPAQNVSYLSGFVLSFSPVTFFDC